MSTRIPTRTALLPLVIVLLAPACRSSEHPPSPSPKAQAVAQDRPAAAPPGPRKFGAPLTAGNPGVALSKVLETPDEFASRTVTVEAQVRRNCTRRGCWMELADGLDPNLPGCRVTFKDYGFFVPLDSAGSKARVEGAVEVRTVSAPEVQHLEGEGARFAGKQPDGSAREVRMVANGVELWREQG